MSLVHGGDLLAAQRKFGIPRGEWLDLSTGISPWSWPVPPVPESVWQSLPYSDNALERVAARYYGVPEHSFSGGSVLAIPGSQFAISVLPGLVARGKVAMPTLGYAEHRHAWRTAGHTLVDYEDVQSLEALVVQGEVDHAVVINPNNPTGVVLGVDTLAALREKLSSRGGLLLVDEAFVDAMSQHSCAPLCVEDGLVVLRSVGKFFGLAGLRLGFFLCAGPLMHQVQELMGPWLVSHAARWIGERALQDVSWQKMQRARLVDTSTRWHRDIAALTVPEVIWVQNPLFLSARIDRAVAQSLFESLGRRGVLIRVIETDTSMALIRLGLPHENQYLEAHRALQEAVLETVC